LAQGDGVVDAVADEAYTPALGLQFPHPLGLLRRQGVGEVAVHA
jgi:hypothetical protein